MDVALVMCPIWNVNEPPLATAYLSGAIKASGHTAFSFDLSNTFYNSLKNSDKELLDGKYSSLGYFKDFETVYADLIDSWIKKIMGVDPRIVCFSLYDSTIAVSRMVAARIRALSEAIVIIGGGPSVSSLQSGDYDLFDVMVHGEGEETLVELVSSICSGRSYRECLDISYKCGDEIISNGKRGKIDDINSIPFPDFDDYDLSEYAKVLPMFTSRGCYGKCTFCAERPQWGRYRFRTAQNIVAEMERNVLRYNVKVFNLADSLINGNHAEFIKMCELILEKKLKVKWGGKARIESKITPDQLRLAHDAGCRYLLYGVESASQRVIDHMGKNISVADIKRIIRDTSAAKIKARCFFIVGYVNESEDDYQESVSFIKEYHKYLETIYCGSMNLIQWSELYENHEKYGIEIAGGNYDRWTSLNGANNYLVRAERLHGMQQLISGFEKNKRLKDKIFRVLGRIKKQLFSLLPW